MLVDPHFIKFEKPKNELYLTFSAVIKKEDNECILNIQKTIIKIVKEEKILKDLGIEEERKDLYGRIEKGDRFIYKYPRDKLHFSIVNFATYKIVSLDRFEKARDSISHTINFEKLKDEVCNFEKLFNEEVSKNEFKVEIRRIYLPSGVEDSLALNAFSLGGRFFKNLKSIVGLTENKINQNQISHEIEIKAYPKDDFQYFALNMFRFIDSENKPEKERFLDRCRGFYKKIEDINKDIKIFPFTIKMKPCIVISDPYLANKEPYKIDCQ